ncbi:MAG: PAS domain-containing protein [Anaerolineaceae bacterium]|nr:PAS domain-containing protein [Anaerolineaceae bacterium]
MTTLLLRALQNKEGIVVDEEAQLFSNLEVVGTGWNAVALLWNGTEILGWLACDNGVRHLPISKPLLDIFSLYALTLGALLAQKQAQLAFAEQRNLLRTVIDTLPDQIFLKDRQSHFMLVNQATVQSLMASKAEEVLGKSDFDFMSHDIAQRLFDEEQTLLQSGATRLNTEGWVGRPEGHQVYLSTIKLPLRDAQGQITGLLGTNRDMTEHWQLQNALIDKEKLQMALEKEVELSHLKSRMMERISHEFRTPLAIIQLTTETFMSYFDRLKPEQRVQKALTIQQSTQRLTNMLERIGDVVKDDSKAESLHLFPFNLRYIIDACTYELEQQLHQPEKYVLNLPDTIKVVADRDVIKDALFPILQNAAIYCPLSSPVIVQSFPVENGIELRVSDSGIGILADELSRIFNPFFRGSNINEIGGLGIGLTIAERAIAAHKGTIKVESTVGKGTTVKVWLPN